MSFRSTTSPPQIRLISPYERLLVDPITGAPLGIQNLNAGGNDGIFTPIPCTADQLANPTAAMIADVTATYALNVAPYTRWQSDGTQLVPETSGTAFGEFATLANGTAGLVPVGAQATIYDTLTVSDTAVLIVQGELRVGPWPFGS